MEDKIIQIVQVETSPCKKCGHETGMRIDALMSTRICCSNCKTERVCAFKRKDEV